MRGGVLASAPRPYVETMRRRIVFAYVALALLCSLPICCAAEAKKTPPAHPVDLNSATAAQLEQVPGIGPSTARAIIAFREKSSPFRRVEDLLAIHGISRKKLDQMRPYLTVVPVKFTKQ